MKDKKDVAVGDIINLITPDPGEQDDFSFPVGTYVVTSLDHIGIWGPGYVTITNKNGIDGDVFIEEWEWPE